ncbi:MAG: glycosyltransferase [Anaerolineae bacterium]
MLFWLCLAVVVTQGVFGVLSIRHYGALPRVPTVPRRAGLPRVSIIVPARNEAANLGRLLASLLNLDYASYEVIVVDDTSSDATSLIASEFDSILLHTGKLPPGWTGKNYACYLGAQAATGDWLLFTDADTEHAALSLASTIGYVLDRRLDALSVLVGQDTLTFWERLLLPFCYQQFFVGVPGGQVNNSRKEVLLANGQYLLIRRDAYDQVGGHEVVRSSMAEDVRLAHLLKAYHLRYAVARGEHLVFARLYHKLSELWTNFARNSFQFMTLDSRRGGVVLVSAAVATLMPTLLALGLRSGLDAILLISAYSYAFLVLGLMAWGRIFRVPAWYSLLQPLSAVFFWLVALNSAVRALLGVGITWKGRTYGGRWPAIEPTADHTPEPHKSRMKDDSGK